MLVLGGQGRSHAASCVSSVGAGEAPPPLGPDGALYLTTDNGSNDRIIRVTATQP